MVVCTGRLVNRHTLGRGISGWYAPGNETRVELACCIYPVGSTKRNVFASKPANNVVRVVWVCELRELRDFAGGLSILVPERREEVLQIAPRSIVSGTLVTLITASLVGVVELL